MSNFTPDDFSSSADPSEKDINSAINGAVVASVGKLN
jgi:hypothetical protein